MGPRARCRRRVALLAVLILAVGCSYGPEEPGLFGRDPPTPSESSPPPARTTPANPDLPVVGDEVWTSADGTSVTVRIAIHAVRRLPRATVLDWSVTALSAPRLTTDATIARVDLGLRSRTGIAISLVDPRHRTVLRPLGRRGDPARCLCTDLDGAERDLRVGETSLQQLAFPALPASTRTVDVVVPTVPVFSRVPVTPAGEVPVATSPVTLDWEPDPPPAARWSPERRFAYATGQRFAVSLTRVIAGPSVTSVEWRIQALTSGTGLVGARRRPLAEPGTSTASTPTVRAGAVELGVLRYDSEALATPYTTWLSALRSAGQEASVITNVPALPNGTQRVAVTWPGLPSQDFAITRAPDRSTRSTARTPDVPIADWASEDGTVAAWSGDTWPTPVPAVRMLDRYAGAPAVLRPAVSRR